MGGPRRLDQQADHLAGRRIGAVLFALLLLYLAGPTGVQAQAVTDMAGRVMTILYPVLRPSGAAPSLTVLLCALAPNLVSALDFPLAPGSDADRRSGTTDLPVLGSAMDHDQRVKQEALLKVQPDLVLVWQNGFSNLGLAAIEAPVRKTGVPVLY